jgi:hypothetical protein
VEVRYGEEGLLIDSPDSTALAYLLARRLALSLSGPGIRQIAESLDSSEETAQRTKRIHPIQYYIIPAVEEYPLVGDIYKYRKSGKDRYAVVLTPSCDFVVRGNGKAKAKKVLLARCSPIASQKEFLAWKRDNYPADGSVNGRLNSLMNNKRQGAQSERFYYLPGALSIPGLIIDFQQLRITNNRAFLGAG